MQHSNRLPTLADDARRAHLESLHHTEKAAERALAAGAALVEAKELCAHGTWRDWLAQTGIPERSAQRYMKLARAGLKSATVADLGGIKEAERFVSKARFTGERDMDRAALTWLESWSEDPANLDFWLQYGAALNNCRDVQRDDEEWREALGPSLREIGMKVPSYEERDAAAWAALRPALVEQARAEVEAAQ